MITFFLPVFLLVLPSQSFIPQSIPIVISQEAAEKIAGRIWENECGKKTEGLTSWNQGEEFASLGIGHFIWYPQDKKSAFHEQFPEFVLFAEKSGAKVPKWLKKSCPWNCKEEFEKDLESAKMQELRKFLLKTLPIQAKFIAKNLENVLPKLITGLPPEKAQYVSKMFYRLAQEPNGVYILSDYLNFKGEGTSPSERYNDKGWGLLQVLEQMKDSLPASKQFATAAKRVLAERVKNAPSERNEERFLQGWQNRIDTYLK